MERDDADHVAAQPEKGGMPEAHQRPVAEDQVETHRGNRVHDEAREQADQERLVERVREDGHEREQHKSDDDRPASARSTPGGRGRDGIGRDRRRLRIGIDDGSAAHQIRAGRSPKGRNSSTSAIRM